MSLSLRDPGGFNETFGLVPAAKTTLLWAKFSIVPPTG